MIYRTDKYGNEVSQLGFGCMRFSRKGSSIIYEKAEQEILLAIERGVNYLDTAYIYPGSEVLVGRVLEENHCRDKVRIATKLPHYKLRSLRSIDKVFDEELSRLRTDHVDYYLMHMFTDIAEWEKLESLGIRDWIDEQKAAGRIGQIGFSYHGNAEMFLRVLDAYDWDFCQIQYNYLDETSQAGRGGLEAAIDKDIPVIIMEPLRGGKLVRLPEKAKQLIADSGTGYTPAELGLRWLWDQPGILTVLSGMNSTEMVEENIRIASEMNVGMMSEADHALVAGVRDIIRELEKVGCTDCRYCQPCPKGVDIPGIFHYWNLIYIEGKKFDARFEFARNIGMQKDPGFASLCVGCGQCEQHCPQHLPIIRLLKQADKELRPLPYRAGLSIARKFLGR